MFTAERVREILKSVGFYLGALGAFTIYVGCGKGAATTSQALMADEFKFTIPLELKDDAVLSDAKADLYKDVSSGSALSHEKISQVWLGSHLATLGISSSEFADYQSKITALANEVSITTPELSVFDAKPLYESKLEKDFAKTAIVYNVDAVGLSDVLRTGKAQCYSGTLLHALVLRNRLDGESYRAAHPVFIFEKGHVLPGYFIKGPGDSWYLFGVETTQKGRAIRSFGLSASLSKVLRVVDGEMFSVVETFKNDLKHPEAVVQAVLEKTANRYGIPLSSIEPVVLSLKSTALALGVKPLAANATPFGFGVSSVAPGDQERKSDLGVGSVALNDAKDGNLPTDIVRLRRGVRGAPVAGDGLSGAYDAYGYSVRQGSGGYTIGVTQGGFGLTQFPFSWDGNFETEWSREKLGTGAVIPAEKLVLKCTPDNENGSTYTYDGRYRYQTANSLGHLMMNCNPYSRLQHFQWIGPESEKKHLSFLQDFLPGEIRLVEFYNSESGKPVMTIRLEASVR